MNAGSSRRELLAHTWRKCCTSARRDVNHQITCPLLHDCLVAFNKADVHHVDFFTPQKKGIALYSGAAHLPSVVGHVVGVVVFPGEHPVNNDARLDDAETHAPVDGDGCHLRVEAPSLRTRAHDHQLASLKGGTGGT